MAQIGKAKMHIMKRLREAAKIYSRLGTGDSMMKHPLFLFLRLSKCGTYMNTPINDEKPATTLKPHAKDLPKPVANPFTTWQRQKRRIGWKIHDIISPLLVKVHYACYYDKRRLPNVRRGKWLAGISEFCWCYSCGDSVKFSLHVANIYWGIGKTRD